MKTDSKAYLHFFQGIGIGASGAMLHQYVAFAAVIIALIAFIWSCLDAQDERRDDDQKTGDKATQAPELFTKYQKILNEEDETKLRESFSFSAKDIAKFNRLFQPEKYPYPPESELSEEQDDLVPIHITKGWNPYKKRQSLCPAGTSREYLPLRRSSVPVPPFIVVSSPGRDRRAAHLNGKQSGRSREPALSPTAPTPTTTPPATSPASNPSPLQEGEKKSSKRRNGSQSALTMV